MRLEFLEHYPHSLHHQPMLRFAFKPRHPVTQVAFTADGREVVTAQPFTGIAIRDRLTGDARFTFNMLRTTAIYDLAIPSASTWTGLRASTGTYIVGPCWDKGGGVVTAATECGFGTTPDSTPLLGWVNSTPPTLWAFQFETVEGQPRITSRSIGVTVRTTGEIRAISPDTRFALCFRPRVRPMLASVQTGAVVAELSARLTLRVARFGCLIAFSPDGSKVALGNGESLSVFDLSTVPQEQPDSGKRKIVPPLLTLERPDPTAHGTFADKQAEHWLPPVAFDHAGRSLFTLGLRNRVQRIDLATGGVMNEWGWRCEPIRSLAVSPDDLTAAAGCKRGELVLWDLE